MSEHSHGGPDGAAQVPHPGTDSAGVPWEGRHFEQEHSSNDDGSAPEALMQAIARFRAGDGGEQSVIAALTQSRLLIPLVAALGESGIGAHGHVVDKSAELSIVTVAGPDGRDVLPVFSSVAAMSTWNAKARPVPADAARVALAAASEQTDVVVLDPTSETEFVIRRPALWAIAQSHEWIPSYLDPEVLDAFMASAAQEPAVARIELAPGDPDARMAGPELIVTLALAPGLDQQSLDALLARLQQGWAESTLIAARVDSLALKLVPA
ncbi:SseB family protein [Parafrigoribacterium soli]|uniref:SseB family protein n=1 Tax=Parafrigoribacterium soli TaxID=3144663 RepID=UPI0032EEE469